MREIITSSRRDWVEYYGTVHPMRERGERQTDRQRERHRERERVRVRVWWWCVCVCVGGGGVTVVEQFADCITCTPSSSLLLWDFVWKWN